MEKVSVAFTVSSTNYGVPLGFSVLYNNRTVVDIDSIDKQKTVAFDLEIEDGAQQLNFVMKNKTVDHTVIDESNNIISDACLTINDVTIENVDLGYNFIKHSVYTHNFNGTQKLRIIMIGVTTAMDVGGHRCVLHWDCMLIQNFMNFLLRLAAI